MDSLYKPFIESTANIIGQMTGLHIDLSDQVCEEGQEISSLGVTSIVTFAGVRRGRFLIDMVPELAIKITNNITGVEYKDVREYDVLTSIAELNNIIAGDAITVLNDELKLSLRLAPPIVLCGKEPIISIPKLSSVTIHGSSDHRDLKINIAFEKEG